MKHTSDFGAFLFEHNRQALATWPVPVALFFAITGIQSHWKPDQVAPWSYPAVILGCVVCSLGIYQAVQSSRRQVRAYCQHGTLRMQLKK